MAALGPVWAPRAGSALGSAGAATWTADPAVGCGLSSASASFAHLHHTEDVAGRRRGSLPRQGGDGDAEVVERTLPARLRAGPPSSTLMALWRYGALPSVTDRDRA